MKSGQGTGTRPTIDSALAGTMRRNPGSMPTGKLLVEAGGWNGGIMPLRAHAGSRGAVRGLMYSHGKPRLAHPAHAGFAASHAIFRRTQAMHAELRGARVRFVLGGSTRVGATAWPLRSPAAPRLDILGWGPKLL